MKPTDFNIPPSFDPRAALKARGDSLAEQLRGLIADIPKRAIDTSITAWRVASAGPLVDVQQDQRLHAMLAVAADDVAELEGFLRDGKVDVDALTSDARKTLLGHLLLAPEGMEIFKELVGSTRNAVARAIEEEGGQGATRVAGFVRDLPVDGLLVTPTTPKAG